jgi:uncharacterized protein
VSSLKDKLTRLSALRSALAAPAELRSALAAPAELRSALGAHGDLPALPEPTGAPDEPRVEREDVPLSGFGRRSFAAQRALVQEASYDEETGEFLEPAPRSRAPHAHTGDDAWIGPAPVRAPQCELPLPGERVSTPLGPLRIVRARYDVDHRHGASAPASALTAAADDLALIALDPSLAGLDITRALYLDTETTGLMGGTGTLPFLVGMAWFDAAGLHVEQLFLERPGEEAPILTRLAERIAVASSVVSFNGKSFDWPLLRTRFLMQRLPAPALPPHIDLLHCARRVFKRRLGSVRLTTLEREVLGFERVDDIDGAVIPELYLGYLRGRVAKSALCPVIDHNRMDLVALPTLLGELTARLCAEGKGARHAADSLGYAAVSARADALGLPSARARAVAFAQHTAAIDVRGELAPEAHWIAGELHRRRGELAEACAAFHAAVEAAGDHGLCGEASARAHLALAKLYEHKLGQPARALTHAEAARDAEDPGAHDRRLSRLRSKLVRSEGVAG